MLMRLHWGLGVGHLYSHESSTHTGSDSSEPRVSVPQPSDKPSTSAGYAGEAPTPVTNHGKATLIDCTTLSDTTLPDELSHPPQQDDDEVDLEIVREAEEELQAGLEQLSPEYGERPRFILDDDDDNDEMFEEEIDDSHQQAMYGRTGK